jgi:hypothetical protein
MFFYLFNFCVTLKSDQDPAPGLHGSASVWFPGSGSGSGSEFCYKAGSGSTFKNQWGSYHCMPNSTDYGNSCFGAQTVTVCRKPESGNVFEVFSRRRIAHLAPVRYTGTIIHHNLKFRLAVLFLNNWSYLTGSCKIVKMTFRIRKIRIDWSKPSQ